MNLAILGFEGLGRKVYEILIAKKSLLFRNYDVNIKYIYTDNQDNSLLPGIATNDYNKIINDDNVDLIIDTLENEKAFEYIKTALYSRKHVITASSDVISNHYVELEAIAIDMQVKLLFSATVGGNMPIISSLLDVSPYNEITKIEAILDDDINNLLSFMSRDNMSFSSALESAKYSSNELELDLDGKKSSKELAILIMLAYNTTINIDEIYRYSISNISEDVILVTNLLGYKIKYMASSYLMQSRLNAMIEPVLVKSTDLLSSTENKSGIIRYYGTYTDYQIFSGKNKGYLNANSIISDITKVLSDYRQKFMPRNSYICNGIRHIKSRYLIKPKIMNDFFKSITEKNLDNIIVTSIILGDDILNHIQEIQFYARIID